MCVVPSSFISRIRHWLGVFRQICCVRVWGTSFTTPPLVALYTVKDFVVLRRDTFHVLIYWNILSESHLVIIIPLTIVKCTYMFISTPSPGCVCSQYLLTARLHCHITADSNIIYYCITGYHYYKNISNVDGLVSHPRFVCSVSNYSSLSSWTRPFTTITVCLNSSETA